MEEEKCFLTFTCAFDGDLLISLLPSLVHSRSSEAEELDGDRGRTCRGTGRCRRARSRVDDQLGALDATVQVLGESRGHHPVVVAVGDEGVPNMGSIYSLELPPIRPALSARAYVSRSNRGNSPVASVVAIYSSIRR